jgi:hypothetical protein
MVQRPTEQQAFFNIEKRKRRLRLTNREAEILTILRDYTDANGTDRGSLTFAAAVTGTTVSNISQIVRRAEAVLDALDAHGYDWEWRRTHTGDWELNVPLVPKTSCI